MELYLSSKYINRVYSSDNYFNSLYYENGNWKDEDVWPGIEDDIRGIAEDANGEIWLGTFHGDRIASFSM